MVDSCWILTLSLLFLAGEDTVRDRLAQVDEVYIPIIVLGELYYGARNSGRVAQNVTRIDSYAASTVILDCNAATAREYGLIKKELREKGRPLPENDIWIAAIGRQWDLIVATRDAHFSEIENLQRKVW